MLIIVHICFANLGRICGGIPHGGDLPAQHNESRDIYVCAQQNLIRTALVVVDMCPLNRMRMGTRMCLFCPADALGHLLFPRLLSLACPSTTHRSEMRTPIVKLYSISCPLALAQPESLKCVSVFCSIFSGIPELRGMLGAWQFVKLYVLDTGIETPLAYIGVSSRQKISL